MPYDSIGIFTVLSYIGYGITVNHIDLSSSFKVKIDYENIINLESLSLSLPNNSVAVGQTASLSVGIVPSNSTFKDYTIVSSNTSILKVKDKSVTGVKAGTATLTIQSDTYDSISYSELCAGRKKSACYRNWMYRWKTPFRYPCKSII